MTSPLRSSPGIWTGAAALVLVIALPAGAETVATVADKPISREEVEKVVRSQLIQLENSRYELLESGLTELVAQRLIEQEAAARGVSAEELTEAEITSKVAEPTDAEIEQIYEQSKENLGGASLEEVREQIVAYLNAQRSQQRAAEFVAELREKYEVDILLEPPVIDVAVGDNPSRGGGPDAPVTIVAFSDYECPYCKHAENTVATVLEAYGDKVRYFHRDFPLPFHANAHSAAQAARCAGDQGRFWDYHTILFASTSLSDEKLGEIADGMSLDRETFDDCLESGKYKAAVDADLAAGEAVGVNGTPAFFINGRSFSGAMSKERFHEVIDSEIERKGRTAAN